MKPWVMPTLAYFGLLGGGIGLGFGIKAIPEEWGTDIVVWGLTGAGMLAIFAPASWWRKR